MIVPNHKRKLSRSWEVRKNVTSFNVTKPFFGWNIQKNYTLPDSPDNQLKKVSWIISKFDIEMPEISGCVTEVVKIFE